MKTLFFVCLLTLSLKSIGQYCSCNGDSTLNDIISCDTVIFQNQAKLFWNFNCDSSWLTYESPTGNRQIIFSLADGLQELTGRLGFVDFIEFSNTFLVQNNVISGCCTPPDFYLFDKYTGHLKDSLGRLIYISDDKRFPIVISIIGSNYDNSGFADFNHLVVLNLNNNKQDTVVLPKNSIKRALKKTNQMYPEYLFDEVVINKDILTLKYYTGRPMNDNSKKVNKISIDLTKYSN